MNEIIELLLMRQDVSDRLLAHFLSSAFLGSLAYWLISTTLRNMYHTKHLSKKVSKKAEDYIFLFSFSSGLFISIAGHIFFDLIRWF